MADEHEAFPHDDVIDSRDLHGRSFGPEIDAQVAQAADYCEDWQYGETLIADSHFEDYARELADDIGAIPADAGWPTMYIDWERSASALKMDYSAVEIDGVTYWTRA